MWIVKVALARPYTFIVMALLLLILGVLTTVNTAKDIFPNIGIPVVSVIWSYSGLPPDEMSGRITGTFERVSLITVNNIDHIESQSIAGVSVEGCGPGLVKKSAARDHTTADHHLQCVQRADHPARAHKPVDYRSGSV